MYIEICGEAGSKSLSPTHAAHRLSASRLPLRFIPTLARCFLKELGEVLCTRYSDQPPHNFSSNSATDPTNPISSVPESASLQHQLQPLADLQPLWKVLSTVISTSYDEYNIAISCCTTFLVSLLPFSSCLHASCSPARRRFPSRSARQRPRGFSAPRR